MGEMQTDCASFQTKKASLIQCCSFNFNRLLAENEFPFYSLSLMLFDFYCYKKGVCVYFQFTQFKLRWRKIKVVIFFFFLFLSLLFNNNVQPCGAASFHYHIVISMEYFQVNLTCFLILKHHLYAAQGLNLAVSGGNICWLQYRKRRQIELSSTQVILLRVFERRNRLMGLGDLRQSCLLSCLPRFPPEVG